MKLTIPLTGTVLVEGSLQDGSLSGDDNDPIRPLDIDLGHVSWTLVNIDLEAEIAVVEVQPSDFVDEPTGEYNTEGNEICNRRLATDEEKAGFLQHARHLIEGHTRDELYQMSKCARPKRPFKEKAK